MFKYLSIIILVIFTNHTKAQTTWAGEAAQVLFDNCTSCHNPNGIAPNSLMTFPLANAYASSIKSYVVSNEMPPWTADTSYQHYSQERVLTQAEYDILISWVDDGALEGNASQAPAPPIYNGSQQLFATPDLVINAPNYMSKATNFQDDYVCFVLPSGLTQDRKIKAIEVIPGNLNTVHHCLVYSDATNSNSTDTIGGDCGGPVLGSLMMGYTPGATPTVFPASSSFTSGMVLKAGSDIILAMHYPEGSYGTYDQTKVHFYFYDEPVTNFREIFAAPIISDWSFTIAANTVDSLEVEFDNVAIDFTLLSVFPHMHLLGQQIESHALTATNEIIPLVNIPEWDFEWQDFYWFEHMKKIPAGSKIIGKAKYDNTSSNHHNPNSPPQNISAGLNTSDEMFLIYYHYMFYENGDENINVDSLTKVYLAAQEPNGIETFNINNSNSFPNPFKKSTFINFNLKENAFVNLSIYDIKGQIVKKIISKDLKPRQYNIEWNATNTENNIVGSGIYYYSLSINGNLSSGKLIKL